MLEINVSMEESYDENLNKIVITRSHRVRLEHSLVSASKWESLWKVPFLAKEDKAPNQVLSYVRFMILDDELPPGVFQKLITDHLDTIKNYISDDMTATRLFVDPNAPQSREIITTELIYYWIISLNIPVEFEHWHLNRLMTLIRTVNVKNSPKRKMSARERSELNRARLAKHGTRG